MQASGLADVSSAETESHAAALTLCGRRCRDEVRLALLTRPQPPQGVAEPLREGDSVTSSCGVTILPVEEDLRVLLEADSSLILEGEASERAGVIGSALLYGVGARVTAFGESVLRRECEPRLQDDPSGAADILGAPVEAAI